MTAEAGASVFEKRTKTRRVFLTFALSRFQALISTISSITDDEKYRESMNLDSVATVVLPDASKAACETSEKGLAVDGSRAAKSYLGFTMRIVKSALQKAVRNGMWPLAAVMVTEALGNLNIFLDAKQMPTKTSKAIATNIVNRLMTIAVEDCAASPQLVQLVLERLIQLSKKKLQYNFDCLKDLVRVSVALCHAQHFRPSIMLHSYGTANQDIIKQLGIDLGPRPKIDTFEGAVKERNPWAFRWLADKVKDDNFIKSFWELLSTKYPVLYQAHKLRENAMDHRAFLQYVLMQEIYGHQLEAKEIKDLVLPADYIRREEEILRALKEKRYSVVIPTDSIIRDLHTTRRTEEGATFFREHAAVVNCPDVWQSVQEKFLPVYYKSQFK